MRQRKLTREGASQTLEKPTFRNLASRQVNVRTGHRKLQTKASRLEADPNAGPLQKSMTEVGNIADIRA